MSKVIWGITKYPVFSGLYFVLMDVLGIFKPWSFSNVAYYLDLKIEANLSFYSSLFVGFLVYHREKVAVLLTKYQLVVELFSNNSQPIFRMQRSAKAEHLKCLNVALGHV